jgi:hypothetical protein
VAYRFYQPLRDRNVFKTSVYFLAYTAQTETKLESTFDEARWELAPGSERLLKYDTERRMLAAAVALVEPAPKRKVRSR